MAAEISALRRQIAALGARRTVVISSLGHPGYLLRVPLHIEVFTESDSVTVSSADFELHAVAETEGEAVNELCERIVDDFRFLASESSKLGASLARVLQRMTDTIEVREAVDGAS